MKLKLSVKDRVLLVPIIESAELRKIETIILQSILEQVNFTPDEITELELKDLDNGGVVWNAKKAYDKSLEITNEQAVMLKKVMEIMDQRGKFNIQLLPLDVKIAAL